MRKYPVVLHENLTLKQKIILRSKADKMILTGPAGTSKTYTAFARGLVALFDNRIEKIMIIRSAVATRDLGFLPGSAEDKVDVFTAPYVALAAQLSPKRNFRAMVAAGEIQFESTSFLRGQTFDDAFMIVDEFQNMSGHELETVVTRVGENTEIILCGDSDQSDLRNGEAKEHKEIVQVLTAMPEFEAHAFDIDDIVRSAFVRSYYETRRKVLGR